VREEARRLGLFVAKKPDSQGICFIGKLDMEDFLRTRIPSTPGEITDENGMVIGSHEGLDGFTIGQRAGIRVSRGALPWYVAAKDLERHRLIVVQGEDHPMLYRSYAEVRDLHWTRGAAPSLPLDCEVQVRYRQDPVPCVISEYTGNHLRVEFKKQVKAVTAGQSAVFYQGEECLGGGIMLHSPHVAAKPAI
jgi:tRNA-specific 2-thiouridylase